MLIQQTRRNFNVAVESPNLGCFCPPLYDGFTYIFSEIYPLLFKSIEITISKSLSNLLRPAILNIHIHCQDDVSLQENRTNAAVTSNIGDHRLNNPGKSSTDMFQSCCLST